MEVRNNKQLGEMGERVAIGELAKYGIDVLFPMSELVDRRTITLRTETPKNGQVKGINFTKDYVISEDRISKIFC